MTNLLLSTKKPSTTGSIRVSNPLHSTVAANYTQRDYQFKIVEESLFNNTMVCLPTGLGKTFIAAVVMLNFYRWFPSSKVVFMAPTKPLVGQQIEACHKVRICLCGISARKVTGIPQEDTCEMTGHMKSDERSNNWQKKRVFFVTPQILVNDIKR